MRAQHERQLVAARTLVQVSLGKLEAFVEFHGKFAAVVDFGLDCRPGGGVHQEQARQRPGWEPPPPPLHRFLKRLKTKPWRLEQTKLPPMYSTNCLNKHRRVTDIKVHRDIEQFQLV